MIVLVVWLILAAATWWTAPRKAGYDDAKAAVAEKRLTAYQWGDSWDTTDRRGWFDDSTLRSTGTQGPIFAWRTGDGRVRWTDTEDFGEVTIPDGVERDDYSGPGATGLAQALTAAGLNDRAGDVDARNAWISGAEAVLTLLFLGVVIAGPAPVRGTRWFWFWLTLTAPYGLGLVYWLLRDRPWSPTAPAAPTTISGETRDRGWFGLLIGILASFLVGIIVAVLHGLLGDQWVP
ncbi:hypothetical protein Q0Z83_025070 [Actinoplanes sichuanensis]|nr:hypothetical protein Q0Z83_025070 [Actinoplanes sichuanensis]